MAKTIAVVGAGPGVGLAVAQRFGRAGYKVALISRDAAKLDALAGQLKGEGIEAAGSPADILDRPALIAALGQAASKFGGIDVLEYGPTPTMDKLRTPTAIDVENEQYQLDLTVLGAIAAVRAVLPAMLDKKAGALLFTTAASAMYPVTFTGSFGVAAGAALNYARVLFQELAPQGIYAGIVAITGIVCPKARKRGRTHPACRY